MKSTLPTQNFHLKKQKNTGRSQYHIRFIFGIRPLAYNKHQAEMFDLESVSFITLLLDWTYAV